MELSWSGQYTPFTAATSASHVPPIAEGNSMVAKERKTTSATVRKARSLEASAAGAATLDTVSSLEVSDIDMDITANSLHGPDDASELVCDQFNEVCLPSCSMYWQKKGETMCSCIVLGVENTCIIIHFSREVGCWPKVCSKLYLCPVDACVILVCHPAYRRRGGNCG